jgi:UDP-glucose 4-epimerase
VFTQKRVLITGGAGFIGAELTRQICGMGGSVLVVDNLINGKRRNLIDIAGDRVRLEVADIRDAERMQDLLQGLDVVFHLACLGVRHSIHSPDENHQINATATLMLLSAARAAGVKRFVYVSSSEVYGTAQWVPMTEQHPTLPMTVYGASKLAGECYTRAFYRTYGFPTVIVRPFNTYGPQCHHEGDSGEVIPKFLLRCLTRHPMIIFGDGIQTRDFTYVSDTARGILMAGLTDHAVGETINLGSGHEIAINDLAHEVAAAAERPDTLVVRYDARPGDVLRLCADTTKARELLSFEPRVTLREGLIKLKQWYLALPQTPEMMVQEEVLHNWNLVERARYV